MCMAVSALRRAMSGFYVQPAHMERNALLFAPWRIRVLQGVSDPPGCQRRHSLQAVAEYFVSNSGSESSQR